MPESDSQSLLISQPPVGGGQLEVAKQPAATEESPISLKDVAAYFDGVYANRLRQRFVRGVPVLILLSASLLLAALSSAKDGELASSAGIYQLFRQQSYLVVPALIALIIAMPLLNWLWGWEIPVGLCGFIVAMAVYGTSTAGHKVAIALAAVSALAAGYGIVRNIKRPRYRLDLQEFEPQLDRWTAKLLEQHIALKDLPPASGETKTVLVRSFPKPDRASLSDVRVRAGEDGKTRVTPLAAVLLEFRPDTLAVIEGAIDLKTGKPVSTAAREFAYEDLIELIWLTNARSASAEFAAEGAAAPQAAGGALRALARSRRPRLRDMVELRLYSGRSISIVLRDTWPNPAAGPLEDQEKIRDIWKEVLLRQHHAR
jgi:hypothetical protein